MYLPLCCIGLSGQAWPRIWPCRRSGAAMTEGVDHRRNGTGLSTSLHTTLMERNRHAEDRLTQYLPRLGKMSTQLKQTSAQIEDSVMEVCASFQGIAQRAKAAVTRTASVLGQDDDHGSAKAPFDT